MSWSKTAVFSMGTRIHGSRIVVGGFVTFKVPLTVKKLAELPAVDMQHPPAKLQSKLYLFAYVDF